MRSVGTFEDWYEARYRRLLGAVALAVGNLDEAREATDEAFCRALARWPRVGAMDAPEAWTYRVAVNVHKRRARRRGLEARFVRSRPVAVAMTAEWPTDTELWAAVAQLPPRQRAVVALRFVADMTEADIATALGIARGTVASTLHDALRTLRGSPTVEELRHG
jgi:RNA polymerase sigma-70 factor (ECF subfamily)